MFTNIYIATTAILLLGIVQLAFLSVARAGTNNRAIFVTNGSAVTAYPVGSSGDVVPIAVTTDMVSPTSMAIDADGRIYVTNSATNTVTIYAANSAGNVPPLAVIGGSNTAIADPEGIALDASKNIYVLNAAGKGSITVYPAIGAGTGILNEAPSATIAGRNTLLDSPTGIAVDSHGAIYVTNRSGGSKVRGQPLDRGSVTVYGAGSNGNVAPMSTISGAASELSLPVSIALDSSDNIYVDNQAMANGTTYRPNIAIYAAGSTGNVPPMASITGTATDLSYPGSIALDSNRNIYTIGFIPNAGYGVIVFPAGSAGNVAPIATLLGANTGLGSPNGFAFDLNRNFYALNSYGASNGPDITVYPPGSSGDAAPIATISSNSTGLAGASGIAVAHRPASARGSIFVANGSGGSDGIGSIIVYPADTYATGQPLATIAGDITGLNLPYGIALDPDDNIFVLNAGDQITVYPVDSTGNTPPSATLNIDNNGAIYPSGIALDGEGQLYLANQRNVACNEKSCYLAGTDKIEIFPALKQQGARWGLPSVNLKPTAVITGFNTQLMSPSAIAVDGSGTIYVANEGPYLCFGCGCIDDSTGVFNLESPAAGVLFSSITVYAPGSNGNVAPVATISGPHTRLGSPQAIALDSNGNIYVLTTPEFNGACSRPEDSRREVDAIDFFAIYPGSNKILIFAAGSNGDGCAYRSDRGSAHRALCSHGNRNRSDQPIASRTDKNRRSFFVIEAVITLRGRRRFRALRG